MNEPKKHEHFFQQRLAAGEILDHPVALSKSFPRETYNLPPGPDEIKYKEYTIPLEENTAVIRIAEMFPSEDLIDKTKPGRTLVIFGGGTSPGPGSNIKLGVELMEKLQSKKQKSNITRILFVSHPSGAPREKHHTDQKNLRHSADLAVQALKTVDVGSFNDLLFMGFSAGGSMSLETAAILEQQAKPGMSGNRDIILLEPVGVVQNDPKKMTHEFFIGNSKATFRKSKGLPIKERVQLFWKETQNSYATIDGVPSPMGIVRDIFQGKKRHLEYAGAYGMSEENMAPTVADAQILATDFTKQDRAQIKGNVLLIENGGGTVVNHPVAHLEEGELDFPKAKSAKGLIIENAMTHSFTMTDDGRTMDAITKWLTQVS